MYPELQLKERVIHEDNNILASYFMKIRKCLEGVIMHFTHPRSIKDRRGEEVSSFQKNMSFEVAPWR